MDNGESSTVETEATQESKLCKTLAQHLKGKRCGFHARRKHVRCRNSLCPHMHLLLQVSCRSVTTDYSSRRSQENRIHDTTHGQTGNERTGYLEWRRG
ncbi:hypothetical protein J6590_008495 [Homalodisca vitripennis]|nr:hypothetical protein J6590_008495 [Homalodisca vitripennis]